METIRGLALPAIKVRTFSLKLVPVGNVKKETITAITAAKMGESLPPNLRVEIKKSPTKTKNGSK